MYTECKDMWYTFYIKYASLKTIYSFNYDSNFIFIYVTLERKMKREKPSEKKIFLPPTLFPTYILDTPLSPPSNARGLSFIYLHQHT